MVLLRTPIIGPSVVSYGIYVAVFGLLKLCFMFIFIADRVWFVIDVTYKRKLIGNCCWLFTRRRAALLVIVVLDRDPALLGLQLLDHFVKVLFKFAGTGSLTDFDTDYFWVFVLVMRLCIFIYSITFDQISKINRQIKCVLSIEGCHKVCVHQRVHRDWAGYLAATLLAFELRL